MSDEPMLPFPQMISLEQKYTHVLMYMMSDPYNNSSFTFFGLFNRGLKKFSLCLNSGGLRVKREDGNPKKQ